MLTVLRPPPDDDGPAAAVPGSAVPGVPSAAGLDGVETGPAAAEPSGSSGSGAGTIDPGTTSCGSVNTDGRCLMAT